MTVLVTLGIIVGAVLLVIFSFVQKLASDIERSRQGLIETLWARRAVAPLFLEIFKQSGNSAPHAEEIIDLRRGLMSQAYTLAEELEKEEAFTKLLAEVARVGESEDTMRSNSLFHALHRELQVSHEKIEIARNDYDFFIAKWQRVGRVPLLRIFQFLYKIDAKTR